MRTNRNETSPVERTKGPTLDETSAERRDGVSFTRLLWVGPLTVVVALVVNLIIQTLLQAINPSLAEMGQLGRPLIILTLQGGYPAVARRGQVVRRLMSVTLQGAILAVSVFGLMPSLVPHPIGWFGIG